MPGETSLDKLISSLRPSLSPTPYVFLTLTPSDEARLSMSLSALDPPPIVTVREPEGLTLVVSVSQATSLSKPFGPQDMLRHIVLQVQSSLQAVGLTAAFSTLLGEHGISCNVVAGFFHDHIFVPQDRAQEATDLLEALARSKRQEMGE